MRSISDRLFRKSDHRLIAALLLCALVITGLHSDSLADHTLTILLQSDSLGTPTEARLSVMGSDSLAYRPLPDSLCFFHDPMNGYFYADSATSMDVPPGWTRVIATKGPEYSPVDLDITVSGDTAITLLLERWIDPREYGWIGGDAHADLTHEPATYNLDMEDGKLFALAEGLPIANFLDNGSFFTGSVSPLSDSSVILFASEEYRSSFYGHLGLLGIDTLIAPYWRDSGSPLNAAITEEVRGHSHALATYAHPHSTDNFCDWDDWPGNGLGRGIWIDAALGALDAIDIISYSNYGDGDCTALSWWYDLWNAGFPIPASAGSDACIARLDQKPIGGARVYARVPDPYASPQTLYDDWVDGIRNGHTFVSTGPILTSFDVGGGGAGETLYISDGMPIDLPVSGGFSTIWRDGNIEVVVNGEIIESHSFNDGPEVSLETTVPIRESCWIAVRHDGDDYSIHQPIQRILSHPTPVLVLLEGDDLTSFESGNRALEKLDMLDSLLCTEVEFPSAEESLAIMNDLDSAKQVWRERANGAPESFSLNSPCNGCRILETQHLLTWEAAIDPDSGSPAGVTYRLILAADPEFVTILVDTSGLVEPTWEPETAFEEDSTYWWRVRATDAGDGKRWADEIDWWFRPATTTSVEEGSGPELHMTVSPNPSAGTVFFRSTAPLSPDATLTVYNIAGRIVREVTPSGGHSTIIWDGTDENGRRVPNGLYFYRVRMGDAVYTGKLVLVP